jgi:hypothetical protein
LLAQRSVEAYRKQGAMSPQQSASPPIRHHDGYMVRSKFTLRGNQAQPN